MKRILAITLGLKLTVFVFSALALPQKTNQLVLCKSGSVVRTIRVSENSNRGCETTYTKAGKDQVVGSARTIASCRSFLNNIKGNLEEASWTCREVARSSISYGSAANADD